MQLLLKLLFLHLKINHLGNNNNNLSGRINKEIIFKKINTANHNLSQVKIKLMILIINNNHFNLSSNYNLNNNFNLNNNNNFSNRIYSNPNNNKWTINKHN